MTTNIDCGAIHFHSSEGVCRAVIQCRKAKWIASFPDNMQAFIDCITSNYLNDGFALSQFAFWVIWTTRSPNGSYWPTWGTELRDGNGQLNSGMDCAQELATRCFFNELCHAASYTQEQLFGVRKENSTTSVFKNLQNQSRASFMFCGVTIDLSEQGTLRKSKETCTSTSSSTSSSNKYQYHLVTDIFLCT